ncbi:hypothetical protein P5P86_11865 [Nocardioides sp. BP30]|uniref:hypothetical protein n=1 Tax=Nocardioides sp. BP30 TaxID=3036374 RepID=UPI002468B11A|nr:hypothetical protein [Nocardioides sp. BP30]WGL50660.1 hypothetical protein P5P86_11865 [Nocardioides sp. BP30]
MTTLNTELDVHDMVRELTESYEHREVFTFDAPSGTAWQVPHGFRVGSLIDQLLTFGADSSGGAGSHAGSVAHSQPALPLGPFDLLAEIDRMAAGWITYLGGQLPAARWVGTRRVRGSLEKAKLRRLHALMPQAQHCRALRWSWDPETEWCCSWHCIEFLLSGWWHRARVLLGWDPGAYRPYNTCPTCNHKGLVVDPEAEFGSCSHCPATYAGADWRLLLLHIRVENDLTREDSKS